MLFSAFETSLTVAVWILALLSGAALIAVLLVSGVRSCLRRDVSRPFALLREMIDERLLRGALLPARCLVHSVSDGLEPPDCRRPPAGAGLRGWQSDGR